MDFSHFLKEKSLLLNGLKNREIPFFRAIVDYHLGEDSSGFITEFEDVIDHLKTFADTSDIDDETEVEKTWDAFLELKDQFYKIILDDSFANAMNVIKKEEDIIPDGLSDIEVLCRRTVLRIIEDLFQKQKNLKHENPEPYFRILWNYLLAENENGVKRIMTFDCDLKGVLLYSKMVFHPYGWLRKAINTFNNINKDIKKIEIDSLSEVEKQALEDEIMEAKKTGEEMKTALSSMYYAYSDILFHALHKCFRKQFEVWLLHDVAKTLQGRRLLSSDEMKLILACLTQDDNWQKGQEQTDFKSKLIFANPHILDWSDPAINMYMDNINENIAKLNLILKKFIENQIGKKYASANTFYRLYLAKISDKKENENESKKLTAAFMELIDNPSTEDEAAIRDILLDKIEVDELEKYNERHKKRQMKDRINDYFQQDAERAKSIEDENPDCAVYKCILELPGLNAKAVEVFSKKGGEE